MTEITDISILLLEKIGNLGIWLKTIGIAFVLWIILMIVNFLINRKRIKEIYKIKDDMKRIEKKIDLILKRKR